MKRRSRFSFWAKRWDPNLPGYILCVSRNFGDLATIGKVYKVKIAVAGKDRPTKRPLWGVWGRPDLGGFRAREAAAEALNAAAKRAVAV